MLSEPELLIGQALIDRLRELRSQGCAVHQMTALKENGHYRIQWSPPHPDKAGSPDNDSPRPVANRETERHSLSSSSQGVMEF